MPSWAFVGCFVVVLLAARAYTQDIRVRVLNARSAKPINNECLNVWVGPPHGEGLLVPTNSDGIAVLHITGNEVKADEGSASACNGNAVVGPRPLPSGTDAVTVFGANYVDCQEYAKVTPGQTVKELLNRAPSYSIKKILESGISASNRCGKARAQARPGELVIFERPPTFWERIRQ